MRQTELHLSEEARSIVERIRAKGLHQSREVNRAHILSSLVVVRSIQFEVVFIVLDSSQK